MSQLIFDSKDEKALMEAKNDPSKDGQRVAKLKDHLYMTYLFLGIVAFGFGIIVSYQRLKKINMAADIGVTQGTPPSPPMAASVSVPAAATTTAAAPMAATMAEGGATSSGGGFFKSLNWLEIGFMVLGATSLFFAIKYYKTKMEEDKKERAKTQRQLDEVKMNVQNALKNKYKSL